MSHCGLFSWPVVICIHAPLSSLLTPHNLRDDLDSRSCEPPTFVVFNGPMLSHFDPVTEKEISELIV